MPAAPRPAMAGPAAANQALALDHGRLTAQDHFLIGVHHAFYASPIDYAAALDAFEQGRRRDPGHGPLNAFAARAKAGLGLGLGENGRREALAQAHMAMAAGDSQSLAIGAWSAAHLAQDFEPALRAIGLATRINPLSRVAWSASAWVRCMAGETETPIQHWNHADRCDPFGSNITSTQCGRAICHWLAGRFAEAARAAKRGLDRQPSNPAGLIAAIAAAIDLGDEAGCAAATEALLRNSPPGPEHPAIGTIPIRDPEARARLLGHLASAVERHGAA